MASLDHLLRLQLPSRDTLVLAASVLGTLLTTLVVVYLVQLNRLLGSIPEEVRRLSPNRWTATELKEAYRRLEKRPITVESYREQIPPRLDRRYVVVGGSGLVGGYIVLQLLARGQSPESIRIIDFQPPSRPDMTSAITSGVTYIRADISSSTSTSAAFSAPWPSPVSHLALTVFHTAAVIVPSDRSPLQYALCEAVNVRGTRHVVSASIQSGADVLISTTSASIAIRPVQHWSARILLGHFPRNFFQLLDTADFSLPLRPHAQFFGNYPASKACSERIVTSANSPTLRTGCIRPANGVYGNPTDNTVAMPLLRETSPQWTTNIVQSFVHGANAALAHLCFEAVLAEEGSERCEQAGRPFVVTDEGPGPITYGDCYFCLGLLASTPFRTIRLPPAIMLLMSYLVEWYCLSLIRWPFLQRILPTITSEVKHLKPGLFSIAVAHLVASNDEAARSVEQGGIAYRGVFTTVEGVVQEVVEWNREQRDWELGDGREGRDGTCRNSVRGKNSVALADDIQKLAQVTGAVAGGSA